MVKKTSDYPTKEEWLEAIKNYKPPPKEKISIHEYYALVEAVKDFKCPKHRKPADCDGLSCPSKPDNIFEDYYQDCLEWLKDNLRLGKIHKGEILVE